MALKDWKKVKTGFENTKLEDRHAWETKDHSYGLVLHKNSGGKKYYVGYNFIANPNMVDLANDVSKEKAMGIAKSFMRTH